jgi:hypothetical protein
MAHGVHMYTEKNFKTKKALKEAVIAYNSFIALSQADQIKVLGVLPQAVRYFQPGPFGGNVLESGVIYVEGPHYPQAHTWYATCTAKDGAIIKVK